jgi:glycosyltransferase involved in cell wall biosynthesis
MDAFCLNPQYSTTRMVTRQCIQPTAKVQGMMFLPPNPIREGQGGLRTKGFFKQSLPDKPLISVITVVFMGEKHLEETIQSVINQTYDNVEYIIIDGGSTDGTLDIISKYDEQIDYWVSEPDNGIYDAMNKAIKLANGQWISMMNCSDTFNEDNILQHINSNYINTGYDFIYSDGNIIDVNLIINKISKRFSCNHNNLIINHQCSIYNKALHDRYGFYLVAPQITISDYLFFSLIGKNSYIKCDRVIANCDINGLSQSKSSVEQKFIIDYLINGISKTRFILYFLFYYYKIKFWKLLGI